MVIMELKEDTPEDHRRRSDFIRTLVQNPTQGGPLPLEYACGIPRAIVQFWHKRDQLPSDVSYCIKSWKSLEAHGFKHLLFDQEDAKQFISERLGERHSRAFEKCYHPAMQSDYFRLCYISVEGGFYVDTDDVYLGTTIDNLFSDGRLKIQPLCYDLVSGSMLDTAVFTAKGAYSPDWIFYFNNNPLIAPPHHAVIDRALAQSTLLLECSTGELPEIQSTTGPGNLSKSIFELGTAGAEIKSSLQILSNWESTAYTEWHLSYRHDSRNWRLSNKKQHQE
ncbi:hypothetical protein TMS3_0103825 [Pseudomonas taeanensis MS-3]|uniref:Glycosyl transferase n=2 Tax=Pseudomonas taeanensis TaxID=574962 RepID=A0A0A1YPQ2_9PSED|nr:hypothetical protein TMS3_0103825 [Pseudomonas taeanensis MS-3]